MNQIFFLFFMFVNFSGVFSSSLFGLSFSAALARPQVDQAYKGFVEIAPQRELYVEYDRAGKTGKTLVLLNGLTYSTAQWQSLRDQLVKLGYGVLRFDFFGMGKTLLKYGPVLDVIPQEDQVRDLDLLIQQFKLKNPCIIGLSYGGGIAISYIAKHPKNLGEVFLMAPYLEPLPDQDKWIESQIWYTEKMWDSTDQFFPLTRRMRPNHEQLYNYFLKVLVYTTYPLAEPSVLENSYKLEAVYRLAQGIRKLKASDLIPHFPNHKIHLMISGKDQCNYSPKFRSFLVFQKRYS